MKNKNYYLLFLLIFAVSCQKDDFSNNLNEGQVKSTMNIWKFPASMVYKEHKSIKKAIQDAQVKLKGPSFQKNFDTNEFSINEEFVQVIFTEDYKQFTFLMERERGEPQGPTTLHNYVYKLFNDETTQQFIVEYFYGMDEDGNTVYDPHNSSLWIVEEGTFDIDIIQPKSGGCVPEFISSYTEYTCVDVACTGGANHEPGDPCDCGTILDCEPAYQECGWQTIYAYGCGGGSGGGGEPWNPFEGDHGGGSGAGKDRMYTLPFDNFLFNKECKKITTFLDNNPNFKTKMQELSDSINLNKNHEQGLLMYNNETSFGYFKGPDNQPFVPFSFSPAKKVRAIFHTHPNPNIPSGTSSTFSLNDLAMYAQLIRLGWVTEDFTVFLATQKGTYYAMTFPEPQKLVKLLYHRTFPNASAPEVTIPGYLISQALFEPKYYEYHDINNPNRLLKDHSVDNKDQLIQFLKFLESTDAGIRIFSTDETFDTFTEAKLNAAGDDILEKTCNTL